MAEDGDTRALEKLSAAAIDPTPAECPQHKRRRGLPVADAAPAGFIPYADDGFVALPAEAVPLPSLRSASSAHVTAPTPRASTTCATPLTPCRSAGLSSHLLLSHFRILPGGGVVVSTRVPAKGESTNQETLTLLKIV